MNEFEEVDEIVRAALAVADRTAVDWRAARNQCAADYEPIVRRLEQIHAIARVYQSVSQSKEEFVESIRTGTQMAPDDTVTWGPLLVREKIGRGSYGDVYRAWDPRIGRDVALKVLRADTREGASDEGLVVEAHLLARVRHRNVVTVFGAACVEGRTGLWMELVEGDTLDKELARRGPLPEDEVLAIGRDIASALDAVHRAGLLHRDVKAQNVVRAADRLVLMDFGAGGEARTRQRGFIGTPAYLAPEVLGGGPATPQSDIYALGVLLFHLLTGVFPRGRHVQMASAPSRSPRATEALSHARRLKPILERALATAQDERFATAGEMEDALGRALDERRPTRASVVASLGCGAALLLTVLLLLRTGHVAPLGKIQTNAATGTTAATSVVMKKVDLPPTLLPGAPSLDGSVLSFTRIDGNVALLHLADNRVTAMTSDAQLEGASARYVEASVPSADGSRVVCTWSLASGGSELRVVGADGSGRMLLASPDVEYLPRAWMPDGRSLLTISATSNQRTQLGIVSVDRPAFHVLKDLAGSVPRGVAVSPDGGWIVFDAPQTPDGFARDVFVIRSNGSDERRLVADPANDFAPAWTPDGSRILFMSDRSGSIDLWSIPALSADARPAVVQRSIGRSTPVGLTRSGMYFFLRQAEDVEVYSSALTSKGAERPAVLSRGFAGLNISSAWSPDGQKVAYVSRRGLVPFDRAYATLVIRDLRTQEQKEFVTPLNSFLVRSWSPDGTRILVMTSIADRPGLFQVDVRTGATSPVAVSSPLHDREIAGGDWLPDGRVLYLLGERRALVARTISNGAEETILDFAVQHVDVTTGLSGHGFKMSPDGTMLAFTNSIRGQKGWDTELCVEHTGQRPVCGLAHASAPEMLMLQDWTRDGRALLYTQIESKPPRPVSVWRVPIDGGKPEPLGLTMNGLRDLSVSPDGTRLTFTAGWPKMDLWVLQNFLRRDE